MAYDDDQNEIELPGGNKPVDRTTSDLLPKIFRTGTNKKFLGSTIDQLVSESSTEKVNAYFGQRDSKNHTVGDTYVNDIDPNRENYQFEPSLIIKDSLDNVTFYKDYIDYINTLNFFDSATNNHSKLNVEEYYTWDPLIDLDKFVNFRQYYWQPNGPNSITVFGTERKDVVSTLSVEISDEGDNFAFIYTPDGLTRNPTRTLYRGQTYNLEVNTPGNPLIIKSSKAQPIPYTKLYIGSVLGQFEPNERVKFTLSDNKEYFYTIRSHNTEKETITISTLSPEINTFKERVTEVVGLNSGATFNEVTEVETVYGVDETRDNLQIENNGTEEGTITFTVPLTGINRLFYVSATDINVGGSFVIKDPEDDIYFDVEDELLGKKTFTLPSGTALSNGMKVNFGGIVTPEKYATGNWYVEGVGTAIKLVSEDDLNIPADYATGDPVDFDGPTVRFDETSFDDNSNLEYIGKDYIVVNRASDDRNQWSRANRWFHKEVIEASLKENNLPVDIDETQRANRAIIEYKSGLQLWNFGTFAKQNVDLIDNFTKDVFSNIEGQIGYNIDGIDVVDGMRILFTEDPDNLVNGRIFKVNFVKMNLGGDIGIRRQIALVEEPDSVPSEGETIIATNGLSNAGTQWHYRNSAWKLGQQKTKINEQVLFDIFDSKGYSFSDPEYYQNSSFAGSPVFSYAQGTGQNDAVLGFPLKYRNINNFGDIVFNFNLQKDTFQYEKGLEIETVSLSDGFARCYYGKGKFKYTQGFSKAAVLSSQPVIKTFDISKKFNNFALDMFENSSALADLKIKVFLNNKIVDDSNYTIDTSKKTALLNLNRNLVKDDKLIVKATSSAPKVSGIGKYEIPINLQNNPKNETIETFTLGEVSDQLISAAQNIPGFRGTELGNNNIRDLGDYVKYATQFVQHSGPVNIPLYHLTNKDNNVIKAIRYARQDYTKFKKQFLTVADNFGYDGDTAQHVNLILKEMSKDKTNTMSWYFSDMVGYKASTEINITIPDTDFKFVQLTEEFNLETLSNKSVLVYIDEVQQIHGVDYKFSNDQFIELTKNDLTIGSELKVVMYESTDGSYIPPTPTKLGLYPKFVPQIYTDNTFVEPDTVIQGHDGSITVGYNDYRDDLLLELEKRIYNNIKVEYGKTFEIYDFVPGRFREQFYTTDQYNQILLSEFLKWNNASDVDYNTNTTYDGRNPFTYNYKNTFDLEGQPVQGYWRGIYKYYFDTDRPHTHPWEMLGFNSKPSWWEETYGPAPYTSNNIVMWRDLENGVIRGKSGGIKYTKADGSVYVGDVHIMPNGTVMSGLAHNELSEILHPVPTTGNKVVIDKRFKRPNLSNYIPVDEVGNLKAPSQANLVANASAVSSADDFVFGDHGPVESAWRRSSEYSFSLVLTMLLTHPTKTMGVSMDTSRLYRNIAGQIVYNGKPLSLRNLVVSNGVEDNERVFTSGLMAWLGDYARTQSGSIETYKTDIVNIDNRLSLRLGGFTSKAKLDLVLDSRSPLNVDSIFVPQENYKLILNTSSVSQSINYSGVIVEKVQNGFKIRGYNSNKETFNYYPHITVRQDPIINVGGVTQPFSVWKPDQSYVKGQYVEYQGNYFITKSNHISNDDFDLNSFQKIPRIPLIGGRTAQIRSRFEKEVKSLYYGAVLPNIQDVVDFLLGYEKYLVEQGFVFDKFNAALKDVANWRTSIREFLFWTTQNWADGTAISLSPSAEEVNFESNQGYVDSLLDNFYDYSIKKADGKKIDIEYIRTFRKGNTFKCSTANTADGLYNLQINSVQKEHVVILDNTTTFNDKLYDRASGYRQQRIKVVGYRTGSWDGSYNIPGFIFDQATVKEWKPWTDFNVSDVVKFKTNFYSAKSFIPGTLNFDSSNWSILASAPSTELYGNWDYKSTSFTDFYDLETDNFDSQQQKLAQHLTGYQSRQYLANIIPDDVSQYKFYQGFIHHKGTGQVLSNLFNRLDKQESELLDFKEEWAVRLGSYGSTNAFSEIEFLLQEEDFKLNPQPFELVDEVPADVNDFNIRVRSADVYLKPAEYNLNPFPTVEAVDQNFSAGYARIDDVKGTVDDLTSLLSSTTEPWDEGDYIWCGYEKQSWNIYRLTPNPGIIEELSYDEKSGDLRIIFDRIVNIQVDSIIAIKNIVPQLDKFWKVKRNDLNTIIVNVPGITDDDIDRSTVGKVLQWVSHRVSKSAEIAALPVKDSNTLVWLDENANGHWNVLQNQKVHESTKLTPEIGVNSVNNFGKSIIASRTNTEILVGNSFDNKVLFYRKPIESQSPVLSSTITIPPAIFTATGAGFGSVLAADENLEFLAVGTPNASNVKTLFKGEYADNTTYAQNDVVRKDDLFYKCINENGVTTDGSTFFDISLDANTDWELTHAPIGEISGTASGLENQGIVTLYRRATTGQIVMIGNYISPYPADNENFGAKINVTKNGNIVNVIIGAPGFNNDLGRIYRLTCDLTDKGFYVFFDIDSNKDFKQQHDRNRAYDEGDLVYSSSSVFKAIRSLPSGTDTSVLNTTYWSNVSDEINNVTSMLPSQAVYDNDGTVYGITTSTFKDTAESIDAGSRFGEIMDASFDGSILVVGTPDADNVSLDNFRGLYNVYEKYTINDTVKHDNRYWVLTQATLDGSTIHIPGQTSYWKEISTLDRIKTGKAFVYKYRNGNYDLLETISTDRINDLRIAGSENFADSSFIGYGNAVGSSVAVSGDGKTIAVGIMNADSTNVEDSFSNNGAVLILGVTDDTVTLKQYITSPTPEDNEKFGANCTFNEDGSTLLVTSLNGDVTIPTTFDVTAVLEDPDVPTATTFDDNTTRFGKKIIDSGTIKVYDLYDDSYIYGETLSSDQEDYGEFGNVMQAVKNHIYVGVPGYRTEFNNERIITGAWFDFRKKSGTNPWTVLRSQQLAVDTNKIKSVFLYNRTDDTVIDYLDYIDPIQGKFAGIADAEIDYKLYYDPAVYNEGSRENLIYDKLDNWQDNYVGKVWWNLTRAKFLDPIQGSTTFSAGTWNTLFPTSNIEVCEWAESTVPPEQYNELADTEEGLALGFSGKALYTDTYSTKEIYDNISKTFRNRYYFWVKDKVLVPNSNNRSISVKEISNYIIDPASTGYKFMAFTGSNKFALYNTAPLLNDKDIVLNIRYWNIDKTDINAHNEYQIITQGEASSRPNAIIEEKWWDSLIGSDVQGKTIPDNNLPTKLKYGNNFRPKQSWFINRIEPLKQLVERVNRELENILIADKVNLSRLSEKEEVPTEGFDKSVDVLGELEFIETLRLKNALINYTITDGKIVDVEITNPGFGYTEVPQVLVNGTGSGAKLQTTIDSVGRLTSITILDGGKNYETNKTTVRVRPVTALVKSDSDANNRWALYDYNDSSKQWFRSKTQTYDTTLYWNYIDWYSAGYSQFTSLDYVINDIGELQNIQDQIGDIVKINNGGTSGWIIVEKITEVVSEDILSNYKIIARQNGTIQLAKGIYDVTSATFGYDATSLDAVNYDPTPSKEVRIILQALKEDILIDELSVIYNDLLFASIRYVLQEQKSVDWVFKTSYLKATHKLGELKQKVSYRNDNLENYREFVEEVKPYRTKIREFVSQYNAVDDTQSLLSDFDLPAKYVPQTDSIVTIPTTYTEDGIFVDDPSINEYPWKLWKDNLGFEIESIKISVSGAGYKQAPKIKIEGDARRQATAVGYINNGRLVRIKITDPGEGYLKAPKITIEGPSDVEAKANTVLKTSLVRSTKIGIKFDRTSGKYFFTELDKTDNFVGNGVTLKFKTTFPLNVAVNSYSVLFDNTEITQDLFKVYNTKETFDGYERTVGYIEFTTPVSNGTNITVNYQKDVSSMTAEDRIQFFYDPVTGMLGKDLAQLMKGAGYDGVTVDGQEFNSSAGWDVLPWYSTGWDQIDPNYDDFLIRSDGSTRAIVLPYTPDAGIKLNVYLNKKRIDGTDAFPTPIGDASSAEVIIPQSIALVAGDVIVVRKEESDGSFLAVQDEFDSIIDAGNFTYLNAQGLTAEDITIDGDGFVTETTASASEELVPGQIIDAVDIKVYNRVPDAGCALVTKNYVSDGVTTIYPIGQTPGSKDSVIVKIDNAIKVLGRDYRLNFLDRTVEFFTAPLNKKVITVQSLSANGTKLFESDRFVGDGQTANFVTNTKFNDDLTIRVTVDGDYVDAEVFETDDSYSLQGRLAFTLAVTPAQDQLVNYVISDVTGAFSDVTQEAITIDGSTNNYNLINSVSTGIPETMRLVVFNGKVLQGHDVLYFTAEGTNNKFVLPEVEYKNRQISRAQIKVFQNNTPLTDATDYTFISRTRTIEIYKTKDGDRISVQVINPNSEYDINLSSGNSITFKDSVGLTTGDVVYVTTFSNQVVSNIERTKDSYITSVDISEQTTEKIKFNKLTQGKVKLPRTVISPDYVWVILDNKLLDPKFDYILSDSLDTVEIREDIKVTETSILDVIVFNTERFLDPFGWKQFKDITGRTHYKRLNSNVATELATDLQYYDKEINVTDASQFMTPVPERNTPGVIEINGERIEYFRKSGNKLTQLRRGTMGTGINNVVPANEVVEYIGISETIPYKDETKTDVVIADGSSQMIPTAFTPNVNAKSIAYLNDWTRVSIPDNYGQCDEVEVYVAGRKLRKAPITVHNPIIAQDSEQGNTILEAEFSVNGTDSEIRLSDIPPEGTKVEIVRKLGKKWLSEGGMYDSENRIPRFIREVSTRLPK